MTHFLVLGVGETEATFKAQALLAQCSPLPNLRHDAIGSLGFARYCLEMVEHGPNGAPGAAIALRTLLETKRTVDKESFRTLSKAEHADRDVLAFRIQQGVPISSRSMFLMAALRNSGIRSSGNRAFQTSRPYDLSPTSKPL